VRAPLALVALLALASWGSAATEPLDDDLAAFLAQANQAMPDLAVVVMKDRLFLPPIVQVKEGGSVLFVWADSEAREAHSPQSSGTTGSAALDRSGLYVPAAPGKCFNSFIELGGELQGEGHAYPLSLDRAGERVRKATGLAASTPPGALFAEWVTCPAGSHSSDGQGWVVPYHCRLHGVEVGGPNGAMKGAIVLRP
jgi:plastocyanin